jgi:hypothetical protein
MKPYFILPIASFLLASGSAFASSCSEEVTTLQKRLNSSGARTVVGESQVGATPLGTNKALDKALTSMPSNTSDRSSAGGVEEARSLVEKATAQEKAGDAEGCRNTILKAKEIAGALP